jgi:hypothetical protein
LSCPRALFGHDDANRVHDSLPQPFVCRVVSVALVPGEINPERPLCADTVEKLEKNGALIFCRKPKHYKLLTALIM